MCSTITSVSVALLQVTRQKAIAYSRLETGGDMAPLFAPFNVAELMEKVASVARDTGKSNRVEVRDCTIT
eukprot:6176021-Pleurochrysis_carterae.AAC.1